jgi:pimeloyl-ACP methyl ester carboxylesterase
MGDSSPPTRTRAACYGRAVSLEPLPLPPAVTAALAATPEPERGSVSANGLAYATRSWGDAAAPPLVLIHGVTASSRIWWRVGPALAVGLGRHVIAIDQAGHGETQGWLGHHQFRDNAADLIALIDAAGLRRPDLRVVGHSWGAMTSAWFPALGLRTEALVLLDPPALPVEAMATLVDDPVERRYDDLDEAIVVLSRLNPTWGWGDVVAKAEGLTQFDPEAVKAVLLENGDWDGGLAAVSHPAAAGALVRWIRGDPLAGGLVPDAVAEALERRFGPGAVTTIAGGPHSPMRNLVETTTLALLRALTPG